MNKRSVKRINRDHLVILAWTICLLIVASRQSPLVSLRYSGDSSVFMTMGQAILDGKIIYKDVFDHKGPLIYFVNALGVFLGGATAILILEIIAVFTGFLFLFKISEFFVESKLGLFIVFFSGLGMFYMIEGGNLTEEYAFPFITISLFYYIKYFFKGEKIVYREYLIAGILAASTFCLRANMIAVWLAFLPFIALNEIVKRNYKRMLFAISSFFAGCFIVLFVFLFYFWKTNSFDEMLYAVFKFNFAYSEMSLLRKLQYSFDGLIKVQFFLYTITSFGVYYQLIRNLRKYLFFSLGFLAFYLGTILSFLISGNIFNHYLLVFIPVFALSLMLILKEFEIKFSNKLKPVYLYLFPFLTFLILGMPYIAGGVVEDTSTVKLFNKHHQDKFLIVGNVTQFYVQTKTSPNVKYFYQYPICNFNDSIKPALIEDIENLQPEYLVVDKNRVYNQTKEMDFFNQEILNKMYKEEVKDDFAVVYKRIDF